MKKYRKFTKAELKWIRSLERVMKKAPENLFMFIAGGMMIYSDRYMSETGGVDDKAPSISIITSINMDGGDY